MQPDSAVARLHWAYLQKYYTWVATFEPMCKCVRVGLRGKHKSLTNSSTCFNRWPDFGTEWPGPNHRWLSPAGTSREEGKVGSSNSYCGFWTWDNILTFSRNIQGYTVTHQTLCRHQVAVWCLDKTGPDRGYKTWQLHCCCSQSPWKGCKKAVWHWRTCQQHRLGLRAISPLLHGHRPRANRNKRQAVKSISDNTGAVWALAYMTQASIHAGIFQSGVSKWHFLKSPYTRQNWPFRDIHTKVYVFKKEMYILKIPIMF